MGDKCAAPYDGFRQGLICSDRCQQVPLYLLPVVIIIIRICVLFSVLAEMVSSSRVHDLDRIRPDIFLKPSFYRLKRKRSGKRSKIFSPRDTSLEQRGQKMS
jgi:hypothetical protein